MIPAPASLAIKGGPLAPLHNAYRAVLMAVHAVLLIPAPAHGGGLTRTAPLQYAARLVLTVETALRRMYAAVRRNGLGLTAEHLCVFRIARLMVECVSRPIRVSARPSGLGTTVRSLYVIRDTFGLILQKSRKKALPRDFGNQTSCSGRPSSLVTCPAGVLRRMSLNAYKKK